jgi:hypothetical protein
MLMASPKICFDKILPSDLRLFSSPEFALDGGRKRQAVFRAKKWPNGSTLRVKFLEGTPAQHDVVKHFAPQWGKHANLKIAFVEEANAEIRITFRDDGAWSYVGTDSLDIPLHAATMNFGWLDEGVVLHEFGHAIGLIHEHQNPKGGIKWDKDQVYEDLAGPPNHWDKATVDLNIFGTYDLGDVDATDVDELSIMLYAIPDSWTLDDFKSEPNETLSETDKDFIGSPPNYPFSDVASQVTELTVVQTSPHAATIEMPGEQDLYTFRADAAGSYTIETGGSSDIVMSLYGPDSQTRGCHQLSEKDG